MHKTLMSLLLFTPCLMAQGGGQCKSVGGSILTNFLTQSSTAGTATGDLRGALGVNVLSTSQGSGGTTILHNHHFWVTEAGDTLTFANADATLYPTPLGGFYAASYNDGIKLTGGTGRFAGATGTLTAYGAISLNNGQVVLRYGGTVCFKSQD